MNIQRLQEYWYPVAQSRELKQLPLAKKLLDHDLVIVRIDEDVTCFEDRCPHRQIPLSEGSVEQSNLVCRYHGWAFDTQGELSCIPSSDGIPQGCKLQSFSAKEHEGWIWVKLQGSRAFQDFSHDSGLVYKRSLKLIEADFIHAIENFLDPMHTVRVHKGVLRSKSRQKMDLSQASDEQSFTTHYSLYDQQNGWINKLFDPGIDLNVASFTMPGLAKIAYYKGKLLVYEVSIFFVPHQKAEVGMAIEIGIKKGMMPAWLKFSLIRPFLELILAQDSKVLKTQWQHKGDKPYVIGSTDLVIDHLLYLLGDGAKGEDKKRELIL